MAHVLVGVNKVQRNQICVARGMRYLSNNSTRDDSSMNDSVSGIVVKTGVDRNSESAAYNMEKSDQFGHVKTVDAVMNI